MKKIEFNFWILFILVGAFTTLSFAQSDYETVQKFQRDYALVEHQIKEADSLNALNSVAENIQKLQQEYSEHSELIDKAMYPESFDGFIAKLNTAYHTREGDFTAIDVLKVQVSALKQQVDTMNSKNNELLANLEKLESLSNKNSRQISKLNNLIADLRTSLHKRDELVMNMVDSLLPPVMREKPMLSSEDKEQITSSEKKDNILANVKTTIRDNIKYLDLTSLQPKDIEEIQKQQAEFSKTWSQIGPKLVEVYSEDKDKANELRRIDSLFASWTASVKQEAWNSIEEVFAKKGIPVKNFSSGQGFTNSVNQYIESEKQDIKTAAEDVAARSFELFVDSTWNKEIEARWTPFLVENGMLAENSKDKIDDNIEVWRSELYPSNIWMWIIFAGILAAGLVLLLTRLRKNSQALDAQSG
jgi:hypothetical protein